MRKRRARARVAVRRTMKPMPANFEADELRGSGRVLNLGTSGVFVRTECPPEPGAGVRVVFQDAAGNEMKVEGKVRWSTTEEVDGGPGFGMAIDGAPEDYLKLYREMLRAVGE